MSYTVLRKEYPAPQINKREILRYMGVRKSSDDMDKLVDSCLAECLPMMRYSVCYLISSLTLCDNAIYLDGLTFHSNALTKVLENCDKAVIFSATTGLGTDRLISKYSRISPSRAYCFQAIGTERIEALCDCFCEDISSEFGKTAMRFSPGYGDLDISVQGKIFEVLNSSKMIGLTLNDSLIMSPTKSVTAIVGIKRKE